MINHIPSCPTCTCLAVQAVCIEKSDRIDGCTLYAAALYHTPIACSNTDGIVWKPMHSITNNVDYLISHYRHSCSGTASDPTPETCDAPAVINSETASYLSNEYLNGEEQTPTASSFNPKIAVRSNFNRWAVRVLLMLCVLCAEYCAACTLKPALFVSLQWVQQMA